MSGDRNEKQTKLLKIVHDVIQKDNELRESYQVGEKFRFVRDRLKTLAATLEQEIKAFNPETSTVKKFNLGTDQTAIYIYLFNAKGLILKNWEQMLNPKLFNEYGFNRPIYESKEMIESLLRSKANQVQHAYITVAVNQEAILRPAQLTDSLGHPQVKVKEGALNFKNLLAFHHNNQEYFVDEDGVLIRP